MSVMSTHSEVIDVSQNDLSGPPTVQIEMVAPQTGLRNRVRQIPDGLAHLSKCGFYKLLIRLSLCPSSDPEII